MAYSWNQPNVCSVKAHKNGTSNFYSFNGINANNVATPERVATAINNYLNIISDSIVIDSEMSRTMKQGVVES